MGRILLIEDDSTIRAALARLLWSLGHDVVEAEDGTTALSLAERTLFNLIITDINMPEMDGIEVIMEFRRRRPPVPIIAISGGGLVPKELLLDNARLLGAVSTLMKPFELPDLVGAVEGALACAADGRHGGVA